MGWFDYLLVCILYSQITQSGFDSQCRSPAMARWYSTPESAKNREVTVLAVTETVLATSFTLWLAVSIYGNWTHIAIAACIAPLLLLRTEASNTLNMTWAKVWNEAELIRKSPLGWLIRFTKWLNGSKFGRIAMLFVLFPIVFVFLRVLAIMVTTLRHPLRSITNIPTNWQQITLCTDFIHSPFALKGSRGF